jgi:NADH-quinone oxidoreductase subunit A
MEDHIDSFLPVLIYGTAVIGFAAAVLLITHFLPKPRKNTAVKSMPYESGMDPEGDARRHFDVKFYLVAILFLVFDVELLFLYPWATVAYPPTGQERGRVHLPGELSGPVFFVMLVFLVTLILAYVYALRKGVFSWR